MYHEVTNDQIVGHQCNLSLTSYKGKQCFLIQLCANDLKSLKWNMYYPMTIL